MRWSDKKMKEEIIRILDNIHEAKDAMQINDMLELTTALEYREVCDTLQELVEEYIVFHTKKDKYNKIIKYMRFHSSISITSDFFFIG